MSNKYIKKFYDEINQKMEGNYKIILEPNRNITEDWIEYDKVKWELENSIENFVKTLSKEKTLNFEEKVLSIYKYICLNYIYDDNVLYFFKRDTSDMNNIKYIAVDWYGRIVGEKWKTNRQKHNRRVCYEFARFYAKAINELLSENEKIEACMVGDLENTHYVVGLTGKDYSVILDVDDFNNIKDLTRLKLGLTINGIKILRDEHGKFSTALNKFNESRLKDLEEVIEAKKELQGKDTIKYFKRVIDILNSYHIDSQGFLEYMRSIIEHEGIEIEKIWKEVKGDGEKRYVRCIIFDFNIETYLLDSINKTLIVTNKEKLENDDFIFKPEENEYQYCGG